MKLLSLRLDDELHAQFTLLARLRGQTANDAGQALIADYVRSQAGNGELSSRAEAALAEIEREAEERRRAIASLFGSAAPTPAGDAPVTEPSASKGRGKTQ